MGTNVFDLSAKITLDSKSYENGLKDAKSKFSAFGDGLKKAAGAMGDVLAGVAKGATVAIGAAGTALTALTKQSLDIYANFEQLEGGAKLMFGEASDYIIKKSEEAYKTVQLSQNEYLQQVNGFAVGLKTALGGNAQAAAELADKIVQAEADIVAATGNTQEMVQNAFNGIMRNNYTMLDNLGLGIKPTKEGMEEVIQKVNEWNAAHGKATEYVMDNLADIQAALVDYVEMQGMAGYASMEAGSTITGSLAGVKAAWQNFLSGNGNIKDFTDMLIPTVKNIREKLNKIIPNLTEGLTVLMDEISPHIPELIEDTLPSIIDGASTLITGLAERLPQLVTAIVPSLAQGVINVSTALVKVFPQLITSLKEAGKEIIKVLFPNGTGDIKDITERATGIVTTFAAKITDPKNTKVIIDKGFEVINAFLNGLTSKKSLDEFMNVDHGAPRIIANLAENLVTFSANLLDTAVTVISNLCGYLLDPENQDEIRDAAEDILIALGNGFVTLTSVIYKDIVDLMADIMAHMVGDFDADATAMDMLLALGQALADKASVLINPIGYLTGKIKDYFTGVEDTAEYNNSTFTGYKDEWDQLTYAEKMQYNPTIQRGNDAAYDAISSAVIPKNIAEEYALRYGRGHATGFYANRPAFLSGDVVGENGKEVLLPLENNTEWADILAEKIGGGGVHVDNVNVTMQMTGVVDGTTAKNLVSQVIDEISVQLADLQGRESRGYGLGYIGGTWK